jgi:hypothetical protein
MPAFPAPQLYPELSAQARQLAIDELTDEDSDGDPPPKVCIPMQPPQAHARMFRICVPAFALVCV